MTATRARVRLATTTQLGYGYSHQSIRKSRLAVYRPGDICTIGGEPLLYPPAVAARYLDLAHDHATGAGYLPGLACRYHNRAEGAARGNRMRGLVKRWMAPPRRW